jgi:hypothetical protein
MFRPTGVFSVTLERITARKHNRVIASEAKQSLARYFPVVRFFVSIDCVVGLCPSRNDAVRCIAYPSPGSGSVTGRFVS